MQSPRRAAAQSQLEQSSEGEPVHHVSDHYPDIAIMGAGAIGSAIAAELTRAGCDLFLCARTPPRSDDREQGRPLEWRARNEVLRRRGAEHGIATPISDVIVPLLAAASDGSCNGGRLCFLQPLMPPVRYARRLCQRGGISSKQHQSLPAGYESFSTPVAIRRSPRCASMARPASRVLNASSLTATCVSVR